MKRLANYSQYFLKNPTLIKELIGHSSVGKSDIVYDIGAGSGVISSVLADRCKSVVSIEFEPRMAQKLRENMADYPNVKVIEGDFLELDLPKTPYKIFSNIPFHLSSPIIHKITEADNPPSATYLVVQKQFANKLLPNSDYFTGQLGMVIGAEFAVRVRKRLQRTDYSPSPNVDTAFIEILRRETPLIPKSRINEYKQFIVDCFSDPKIFIKMPTRDIKLKPDTKPSQMKLVQWIELFNAQQRY